MTTSTSTPVTSYTTVRNQHGYFIAGEAMTARFQGLTKAALCTLFGQGEVLTNNNRPYGARYYRQFSKADLVVMAGDVFANDVERHADRLREDAINTVYNANRAALFAKVGQDLVTEAVAVGQLPVASKGGR